MKIKLYHPLREIEFKGPIQVSTLLKALKLPQEAHLVISRETLVMEDDLLPDDAEIEIRPVISGG